MGWNNIFDGVANTVPDIHLESGKTYRLEFTLPVNVPGWVGNSIRTALNMVHVQTVNISGNMIQIDLIVP
jgi:hypothetical protein